MRKNATLVHRWMLVLTGILAVVLPSCTKNNNPVAGSGTGTAVGLSVSFSKPATATSVVTTGGVVDSIRIDSAVVVVQNVTFLTGTSSSGHDDHGDGRGDAGLTFQGPFVIRVFDTLGIDLASQVLPAGTYTGVRFETHDLRGGEHHEDGDDHRHNGRLMNDSAIAGTSVMVWGAVLKSGTWTTFTISSSLETEIEIRANIVVPENAGTLKFALHFNLGLLFRDPMTGTFIDPTNPSVGTRQLLELAIRNALGQGQGGHDGDGDGHPDD